jgi:hypothetical protein
MAMRAMGTGGVVLSCVAAAALLVSGACATAKGTGALAGAGIGGLAGAIIDDGTGAVIGAAIGTGVGYIIGDQVDEKKALEMSQASPVGDHTEVGALGGTRWAVLSIEPKDVAPPFASKVVEFGPNGHVTTTTTLPSGDLVVANENYRVIDDMLVMNKPGYIINAKYAIDGDQLMVNADDFRAVLRRL